MENVHPIFKEILNSFFPPPQLASWEIQTRINTEGGYKWFNVWINTEGEPETFESFEAAAKELREYHEAARKAIEDGDISYHCPDDYRITVRSK